MIPFPIKERAPTWQGRGSSETTKTKSFSFLTSRVARGKHFRREVTP